MLITHFQVTLSLMSHCVSSDVNGQLHNYSQCYHGAHSLSQCVSAGKKLSHRVNFGNLQGLFLPYSQITPEHLMLKVLVYK